MLEVVLYALEMLEVMRLVLLFTLEAVERISVLEVMRCVLLCMLEAMEACGGDGRAGGDALCYSVYRRLWRVGSVCWRCAEVLEAIRCVLLYVSKVVEGGLYLLEVCGGAGGDTPCAALYAGGHVGPWRSV